MSHYELSYNSEGVSITEYTLHDDGTATVEEEWWFTWTELFHELTGRDAAHDIV